MSLPRRSARTLLLLLGCLALGACSTVSGRTGAADGEAAAEAKTHDGLAFDQRLRLARAARRGGNPTTAVRLYRELVREAPEEARARLGLARALLAAQATYEAIAAFETVRAETDRVAAADTGLGRAYLQLRRPEKALEHLNRALELTPDDAVALNARGVALDMLGRSAAAQRAYARAIELQPGFVDARSNRALSLALAGETGRAITILEQLAQRDDASARVRQNLALAHGLAGHREQAQRLGLQDLGAEAVAGNLAFYAMLRELDRADARVGALVRRPSVAEADGLTAAERRAVERTLARLDFAPGPVDGRIDAKTEGAIRRFQKMAGLPVDGQATEALLDELKAVAAPLEDAPERAQGGRP